MAPRVPSSPHRTNAACKKQPGQGRFACNLSGEGFLLKTSAFPLLLLRYVKDVDKEIIAAMRAAGRLIDHSNYSHSYPFCWRSDTPLIYKVPGKLCMRQPDPCPAVSAP